MGPTTLAGRARTLRPARIWCGVQPLPSPLRFPRVRDGSGSTDSKLETKHLASHRCVAGCRVWTQQAKEILSLTRTGILPNPAFYKGFFSSTLVPSGLVWWWTGSKLSLDYIPTKITLLYSWPLDAHHLFLQSQHPNRPRSPSGGLGDVYKRLLRWSLS